MSEPLRTRIARVHSLLKGMLRPGPMPRKTRLTALIVIGGSAAAVPLFILLYRVIGRPIKDIYMEHSPLSLLIMALLFLGAVGAAKVALIAPRAGFVRLFWFVFASLLLLAGLDDALRLHEQADVMINRFFGNDPDDPKYDRLDDMIVAAYVILGFGGAALLVFDHILSLPWACLFFIAGAALFVGMVLADTLHLGLIFEDTMKLLAAACIFCGVAAAEHQLIAERQRHRPE